MYDEITFRTRSTKQTQFQEKKKKTWAFYKPELHKLGMNNERKALRKRNLIINKKCKLFIREKKKMGFFCLPFARDSEPLCTRFYSDEILGRYRYTFINYLYKKWEINQRINLTWEKKRGAAVDYLDKRSSVSLCRSNSSSLHTYT